MKYLIFLFALTCYGKELIVSTTQNANAIVREIGGDNFDYLPLTMPNQDPHFVSAKPSFSVKLSKAKLLISIGRGLEEGWLPLLVRGARNPELLDHEVGHLELGHYLTSPIEVPTNISRADGDVHPEGNPHFLLSPKRVLEMIPVIKNRLIKIMPEKKSEFEANSNNLISKISEIDMKMQHMKDKKINVVTYHKTLNYLFSDYEIKVIDYIEPKPGIPPSAGHILDLLKKIKDLNVKFVLIENYYGDEISSKITDKSVLVKRVPVAVDAIDNVHDIVGLYTYYLNLFTGNSNGTI